MQVLVIDKLPSNSSIEEYSMQVARSWKLGDAKRDDGALLIVAIKDRKMRIEVGQGLEGSLTDLKSKRILDLLPKFFRSQKYEEGINAAVDEMIKVVTQPDAVQGATTTTKGKTSEDVKTFGYIFGGFLVIIIGFAYTSMLHSWVETDARRLRYTEEDITEKESEIQSLKKTSMMYKIPESIPVLEAEIMKLKSSISQKQGLLEDEKRKFPKTESAKIHQLENWIQLENNKIAELSTKVNYYKNIIKLGA